MGNFKTYVDYISSVVEMIGVITIFLGALYSLFVFFVKHQVVLTF